jgi:acyl carrier protein
LFFTVYEEIDENILKKHLEKEIPEYMRPTIFIKLEEFPCNHNGKIDRKQLKNMKYSDLNENKITNNNLDINKEVIQIIKKIIAKNCCDTSLGLADIGIDSLAFINIVVEIENVFDIVFDDKMLDYKCFQSISDLINYIASVIDRK